MPGTTSRQRALASALALAVVVSLTVGTASIAVAVPEESAHKAKPVNTLPTDGVRYRQSFNDMIRSL